MNVYESFVRQAAADIAISPSDETKSLVDDIRARQKRATRKEPPTPD